MSTTISAKRIESDVHLKVTLKDSGVSISWDTVDIKQVCMYSVAQRAFAGHCSFEVSEEDNNILLVKYPASEQLYTGDYRIVARLVLDGDEHTYDALAFTLKALSDESGEITTEDIDVGIEVEEVDTTIMYEILAACQAATDSALAAEAAIEEAEAARVVAEQLREQAEAAREAAEAARVQAEQLRVSAEASREEAEAARVQAEQARVSAEQLRATAETARVEAESARVTAEAARDAAEAARVQAETARVAAEQGRVSAEAARVQAESAREAAEAARVQAESARVAAESARVAAEAAREQQAASDHARAEADHTATEAAAAQAIAAAEAADQAREAIQDDLAKKANKDGSYSQMQVGSAENLIGQIPTSAFFTHRRTGNGIVGTGAAQFKELRGRTLVWNQLAGPIARTLRGITATTDAATGIITFSGAGDGNAGSIQFYLSLGLKSGNKYYIRFEDIDNSGITVANGTGDTQVPWLFSSNMSLGTPASPVKSSGIYTANADVAAGAAIRFTFSQNITQFTYRYRIQIIDITAMFQAGNEPSTVAEFAALYDESYYATNPGSLLPYKGTGLKTTGVNQWDEQWELGTFSSNGAEQAGTNRWRSKNYCSIVSADVQYYISAPYAMIIYFYDADKNFIYRINTGGTSVNFAFTPNAYPGVRYFRIATYGTYTNYNHNICINLSDPNIDGQYFPYEEHTLSIPVIGKTAKDGNGNPIVPFTYGMHGLPTAYDVAREKGGSKVMEVVDMGSLAWSKAGSVFVSTSISTVKKAGYFNLICSKYPTVVAGDPNEYSTPNGKVGGGSDSGIVFVRDDNYTTAADFKAAMSGVSLVYERATPIPFTWDEPLEMNFAENRMGTEELLPVGVDAEGVPNTAPITAEIIYPLDAINTIIGLPKDYISAESFKNYLDARVAAGEIASYTMTFNTTTNKYDFTITRAS